MPTLQETTLEVLNNLQTPCLYQLAKQRKIPVEDVIWQLADQLKVSLLTEVQKPMMDIQSEHQYKINNRFQHLSFRQILQIAVQLSHDNNWEIAVTKKTKSKNTITYIASVVRNSFFYVLQQAVLQGRGVMNKDTPMWERFLVRSMCISNWKLPDQFTKKVYKGKSSESKPLFLQEANEEYLKKNTKIKSVPLYTKWLAKKFPYIQTSSFRLFKQYFLVMLIKVLRTMIADFMVRTNFTNLVTNEQKQLIGPSKTQRDKYEKQLLEVNIAKIDTQGKAITHKKGKSKGDKIMWDPFDAEENMVDYIQLNFDAQREEETPEYFYNSPYANAQCDPNIKDKFVEEEELFVYSKPTKTTTKKTKKTKKSTLPILTTEEVVDPLYPPTATQPKTTRTKQVFDQDFKNKLLILTGSDPEFVKAIKILVSKLNQFG